MACVNHPDVPEVTRCAQCRKRVCQDCYVTLEGRPLCANCKSTVVRQVERGESVSSGERGPTPWDVERSFAALKETVKASMMTPNVFFQRLSWQGQGHYTYVLAVGWLPTIVGTGAIYVLPSLFTGDTQAIMGSLLMVGCLVVFTPVQLFIALFLGGAISHLCLRILSAASAPLETTIRTVGYAQSPAVLNIIPVCGSIVAAIWTLVLQVIGLKEVHETTYGRVIAALLLPTLVCLGLLGVILAVALPFMLRNR